ncbi:MAG: glycosyltransferase [Verrucomicrobiales bacterium]
MNVILTTFGTDGDVFPFIGLGRELVSRGHDVTLATSSSYETIAAKEGFDFLPLFSVKEADTALGNPDFWHPVKCGPLAAKWGVQYLRRQYNALENAALSHKSILVSNTGALAARLLHDKHRIPLASVILQPWVLPSVHKPPILPGGLSLPRWAPKWMWRIYFRHLNAVGDYLIGREMNALRSDIGLPPVKKVFDWWFSPQMILALFPDWYGMPQPDWLPQVRTLSFPQFDGTDEPITPQLRSFLTQGTPPVAITFGTGVRHASCLYQAAAEACARLKKRAILLTPHRAQIPSGLPAETMAVDFAPFTKLFQQCAAVIHHGGIGTTAKALAAKIPQLIVPICFDQLDNALRVADLGQGAWLPKRKGSAKNIAARLDCLLRAKLKPISFPQEGEIPAPFCAASDIIEQMGLKYLGTEETSHQEELN